VVLDAVRGDVLGEFGIDGLFVEVVDLDDLLDRLGEVAFE